MPNPSTTRRCCPRSLTKSRTPTTRTGRRRFNSSCTTFLPGTTSAAGVKAQFLKSIVLGDVEVAEITRTAAFEQLSHMKGGPSVEVLLDLALGENADIAAEAGDVLKTQVFLYEADTERLEAAHKAGNAVATSIIESYAQAEFFTKLPDVEETIDVVTYIAGVGDISTDLLSPGPTRTLAPTASCTASPCSSTTASVSKNCWNFRSNTLASASCLWPRKAPWAWGRPGCLG